MNKTIRDATKEEIKEEYKTGRVYIEKSNRKTHKIDLYNDLTGEIITTSTYTLKDAEIAQNGLAYRLQNAERQRASRLYSKISKIAESNKALFLTLTFNDTTLLNNNVESLFKYVKRYLKDQCLEYIANVDFGSKNGRIHFHAVVVPKLNKVNGSLWRKYGNINFEHFRTNYTSTIKVGKYINKLTNHALKDNGFYRRLIFSRKEKKVYCC